jgi:hypothetical protein
MRIYQITDTHLKDEESFFRAGVALNTWLLDRLKAETKPFYLLHSGDVFHVSKETGRVNGELFRFFSGVCGLKNCTGVIVMTGNHDIKSETGNALDAIRGINSKLVVVDEPVLGERDFSGVYLLPHMRPFALPGYSGIKSYGNEDWHRDFWKARGKDWDEIKNGIKFVSAHLGDESSGEFFMDVDISFLPGLKSHGHIHKNVSKNHLVSAIVTRRDERDKRCALRIIDTSDFSVSEENIPLFLNYILIAYGEDIDNYFKSSVSVLPKESLIVDVYGHDDESVVIKEYTEKYANRTNPTIYLGQVSSIERKGESVFVEERDKLDISSINIKELFKEFCEEKKVAKAIVDDLTARIA